MSKIECLTKNSRIQAVLLVVAVGPIQWIFGSVRTFAAGHFPGRRMLGGDGICSADMGKIAGDAASIVYCAQGGVSLDKTAEGREFLKKYHDTYHTDTQVYAVNYHDGVKMLAGAMVKAGTTTDKARLVAQLAKEDYKGVAGTYSFAENGDLKGAPTTVYVIRTGLPVPYAQ